MRTLNASDQLAAALAAGILFAMALSDQSDAKGITMRGLDNIDKPYIPAAKTNIYETFLKMGWIPPSQHRWYQDKWATYRHLLQRNEEK